jgi:hypothetical protein
VTFDVGRISVIAGAVPIGVIVIACLYSQVSCMGLILGAISMVTGLDYSDIIGLRKM